MSTNTYSLALLILLLLTQVSAVLFFGWLVWDRTPILWQRLSERTMLFWTGDYRVRYSFCFFIETLLLTKNAVVPAVGGLSGGALFFWNPLRCHTVAVVPEARLKKLSFAYTDSQ